MTKVSNTDAPLRSSLLDDEPELVDLIKKYINKYPEMISDLKLAFEKNELENFEQYLHDIKSTGGSYGFMRVTEIAVEIKKQLNNNNATAILVLLDEMEGLHKKMLLAF
jgi:HPt (histidine-containing phosphotransfer) domain-containing protein